jgi:predicted NBD/HSP70 family sugar kinase
VGGTVKVGLIGDAWLFDDEELSSPGKALQHELAAYVDLCGFELDRAFRLQEIDQVRASNPDVVLLIDSTGDSLNVLSRLEGIRVVILLVSPVSDPKFPAHLGRRIRMWLRRKGFRATWIDRGEPFRHLLQALSGEPVGQADMEPDSELLTVSEVLDRAALFVNLLPPLSRRTGRRATLRSGILAIDIGRRTIKVAVADPSTGTFLGGAVTRYAVETDSPEAALPLVASLSKAAISSMGLPGDRVAAVGVSFPAPIDQRPDRGCVTGSQIMPKWNNRSIAQDVHDRLEEDLSLGAPVLVDNDANLGALNEVVTGACRGCLNVLYIKASLGIGIGLILDRRMFRGSTGVAGEVGHMPLISGDHGDSSLLEGIEKGVTPHCPTCGRTDCLEALASGAAAIMRLQTLDPTTYGDLATTKRLVELARDEGDENCKSEIRKLGRYIGIGIAAVVNLLDPQRVVVGGALAKAGDLLLEPLAYEVRAHSLRVGLDDLSVVASEDPETASLRGAVVLARSHLQPDNAYLQNFMPQMPFV